MCLLPIGKSGGEIEVKFPGGEAIPFRIVVKRGFESLIGHLTGFMQRLVSLNDAKSPWDVAKLRRRAHPRRVTLDPSVEGTQRDTNKSIPSPLIGRMYSSSYVPASVVPMHSS